MAAMAVPFHIANTRLVDWRPLIERVKSSVFAIVMHVREGKKDEVEDMAKQADHRSPFMIDEFLNSDWITETGVSAAILDDQLFILSCAHVLDLVFQVGNIEVEPKRLNQLFKFEVTCSHAEDDHIAGGFRGERTYTVAKVVGIDCANDLLLLRVALNSLARSINGQQRVTCLEPHLPHVFRELVPADTDQQCCILSWPSFRYCTVGTGLVGLKRPLTSMYVSPVGYTMQLIQTSIPVEGGSSGAALYMPNGEALGILHGGSVAHSQVISAEHITQFVNANSVLPGDSEDEDEESEDESDEEWEQSPPQDDGQKKKKKMPPRRSGNRRQESKPSKPSRVYRSGRKTKNKVSSYRMGKDNEVSRAVVDDDTALLLSAVDRIKKQELRRLRNGSDTAAILDQDMSTRLLHLACKHDAVECARLLLDGEYGITPSSVDARDPLSRTPLHVAAETHSKRCIQLLLSRNARTDVRLLYGGTPLVALEVALMSKRVQVDWSPDNSVEDLLAYLQQKDLNAVRLLAEKTREVGEVAYRYAMEGRVAALAVLLLVAEAKISATVSVVIGGLRTKRSIYNSVVDEALSIGDASPKDGDEIRKALLCEIQLLNQFGASSWRDRNIDRKTLPPLLRAAKFGDVSVTKMLLMGDVNVNETDPEGNTALHWFLGSSSSTQEPRIVWLLLKNGARVFQGNKLGLTPVHSAAAKGNYKALQSLLLHAQDCVDIPSKTKETPLFLAVKNGSLSCVRTLLRYGANPKAQNLRKQRPIDVATSQDMQFLLNSSNVVTMNHGSVEKDNAMKKERPKELLDDDHDELPESVSDHQSPRSPLATNITENGPHNTDSQHGDACSESNAQSQHDDECSRSNDESLPDGDSTSNGSLLDEITVSTTKSDSVESPPSMPDLIVSEPLPQKIELEPLRKSDLVESAPTKKLESISPVKAGMVQPEPAGKLHLAESRPFRNSELTEPGHGRKLDLNQSRPTTCFVDRPVERASVTPSSCENEMRFSFFHSQWDKYRTPHAKSDYCIICRSCEAAMELVPCLHKICVACMMRCNVRACMTCGTAVSGVKSAPSLDAKSRHVGVMESASEQKCQLMVVCSGADAVVKCSPCMHTIACRGCLLASVTLLKKCTVCDCMVEHFKFGPQGLAP